MNLKKCAIIIFIICISIVFLNAREDISFSFASDDNHEAPTFYTTAAPTSTVYGSGKLKLIVDLNKHSGGGTVEYFCYFNLKCRTSNHIVTAFGPGFVHNWRASAGSIVFRHIDPVHGNPTILRITFNSAIITSWSPAGNIAGPTMTLQVSEKLDPNIIFTVFPKLQGIGVPALVEEEDVSLTLTDITTNAGNMTIPLNAAGQFLEVWKSEGSFSASAVGN